MEQQGAAGLRERQIATFVQNDEVLAGEDIGESPAPIRIDLGLELIDEIDDVEESHSRTVTDTSACDGDS